jgi:hypothetical protein
MNSLPDFVELLAIAPTKHTQHAVITECAFLIVIDHDGDRNTVYWLESDNNLMDIPPVHERTIILGHFEGDAREKFISYENKCIAHDGSRRAARQLGDPIFVAAAHNVRVDVTLIDRNIEQWRRRRLK